MSHPSFTHSASLGLRLIPGLSSIAALALSVVSSTALSASEIIPGATESTPSRSQYFSWINNTNEGATETQTLANLEFFKWMHDEYGMKLDIYAFDAGNIDGPRYYGSMDSDKFKKQFPRGFEPIYKLAKSFDCRLGIWLGPDGFGDTPEEEQARIDMLAGLCRDYEFALFKMDSVCTQLRPEKQDAFARLMTECRKYSPDLILLNHRLDLGKANPYATTFLWGGAETYIDVHMTNRSRTGTHNRVEAISRGLVPDLQRLTEDHGVCLSSCLDFWEDDLILQAFNRNLILSPEIYANPWFLKDDEFPLLARIYNLLHRYRDIMVKGIVLDEQRYGPLAVARGDANTRIITLRNLTWEPVIRKIKLDESVGFTSTGPVEVRRFHPNERILGTFNYGDEVEVEVLPFRSCLLLVDNQQTGGVGVIGSDYSVVRDVPGKDVIIKLRGEAGHTTPISLVGGGKTFKRATLDGEPLNNFTTGGAVTINFPGTLNPKSWHRKIGNPAVCAVPEDAETLYEVTCFAADNHPLEIRSLQRSGPSAIPQVQKARKEFLGQAIIQERGILQQYLFDDDPSTVYSLLRRKRRKPESRYLRLDLGELTNINRIVLETPQNAELKHASITKDTHAEVSADLKTWSPVQLVEDDGNFRIDINSDKPVRYLRSNLVPDKLVEIRGYEGDKQLARSQWKMSWLFTEFQSASKAWSLPFTMEAAPAGSYLAVACNGKHGRDGTWVALKVGDRYVGAPRRAPSFPVNPWENGVPRTESNVTYFIPVTPDMVGKKCEVVVLGLDPEHLDFTPEVWLTAYPIPLKEKTLILSE
ncbi:hypothetical protein JO972_08735 [Verrucomicrobiaceae bacterium 5K15]|uniref:F5/8 type C domain-containing protein n=1 Tax=Oceaniferula flava TaxID=2800421 RepID=A0AAE2V866_9BACT|nr:discoidin domain-containing protein [Oceaniferula flavus]MBK1855042.1 hypothetical protein [Oceaniferula flavus]MBM1136348.1 hypothetical protein [Oceaniferula flavus]